MKILSVTDPSFHKYGRILKGYNVSKLLETLDRVSPIPETGTVYAPDNDEMMALPIAKQLQDNAFGGCPIQMGYCNGVNYMLNCLEYHRDSELNLGVSDFILLLGTRADIDDNGKLDTSTVVAYKVPAGTLIEVYATTLHFAPCCAEKGKPFKCLVVLPKGTNTAKPDITPHNDEDRMLWAKNKWLLAHPDVPAAKKGAWVGLYGDNIDIGSSL